MLMILNVVGPPWGCCTCGWPLFRSGECTNAECYEAYFDDILDNGFDNDEEPA